MTKFTDLATLDMLCGIMGLLVREGRAAAAPKMAMHAQMAGQNDNEQEDTLMADYMECLDDCSLEASPEQTELEGQPVKCVNEVQPTRAAMEAPLTPSPVGSLPPADVVTVEALLSEGLCTVHEIGGTGIDGHRREETPSKKKDDERQKGNESEERDRAVDIGTAMKRGSSRQSG